MIGEKNRACFERVRRERESRDRAIMMRRRYVERGDYSGSELTSNIPATSHDVAKAAERFMRLSLSGWAMR